MDKVAAELFETLNEIHNCPEPFAVDTVRELWDDDHISEQMLAFHLNPEAALASRPHEFIQRSTDWIADRFELGPGIRVADFGCGPGLYTSRFAATGASVTGIDFSRRSIAHARAEAKQRGQAIEYKLGDYLDSSPGGPFDLITMIYCDFCALSPDRRRRLLTIFRDHLSDSGMVILDVLTLKAFKAIEEVREYGFRYMDGFWAAGDYWGFKTAMKYDEEKLVLDRYTIVEQHRIRQIYNWMQYYSLQTLRDEFLEAGLKIVEQYADVSGTPSGDDDVMAVVACKR